MEEIRESSQPASVAISGDAIRRIREAQGLTQLYVAKVVGVTTDTVSRWENNRYPSIRRDNAVKLAEALEVDLEEILQKPEDSSLAAGLPAAASRKQLWLVLSCLFVVAVGAAAFLLWPPPVQVRASRHLPSYAAPGSQVLIEVDLAAQQPVKMILKEKYPSNWQFVASVPVVSKIDEQTNTLRWIFKKPLKDKKIYYLLKVPIDAQLSHQVELSGEVVLSSESSPLTEVVSAEQKMIIAPYHWADRNGDGIIDDMEILTVSDLTETTGDALVGWDQLEDLWMAGSYRWQADRESFVPGHP